MLPKEERKLRRGLLPKEERKLRPVAGLVLGLGVGLACAALKLLAPPAFVQYEFFRSLSELDWGPLLLFAGFMFILGLVSDWLPAGGGGGS